MNMNEPIEVKHELVRAYEGPGPAVRAEDFMPLMTVDQAVERKNQINQFISKVMREGEDYGLMPGNQTKKVLMKPGAEKLCSIFGMAPTYEPVQIVEDWTGQEHGGEPLFYYEYRCQLSRGGRFMGEAIGSCNSWESKYRYRWVSEEIAKQRPDFANLPARGGKRTIFEFDFALEKRETTGQYGKPAEYWNEWAAAIHSGAAKRATKTTRRGEQQGWERTIDETQYRIANPEVADVVNTCQKMAQKRALVAAVLIVTNCSDAFTQDIEDFSDEQQQAAAPVAHTEPAKHTEPETVPEELQGFFKDIDADRKGTIIVALSALETQFVRRAGPAGLKQFNEMKAEHRKQVPQDKETKGSLKAFLVELWETIGTLPDSRPVQESIIDA